MQEYDVDIRGPGVIISIATTVDLGTNFAGVNRFLLEADGGAASYTFDGQDPGTAWFTLAVNVPTIFKIGANGSMKLKGTNLVVQPLRD